MGKCSCAFGAENGEPVGVVALHLVVDEGAAREVREVRRQRLAADAAPEQRRVKLLPGLQDFLATTANQSGISFGQNARDLVDTAPN